MQLPIYLQKILTCVVLIAVLILTFRIRIQGVERIPDGQFTGHDPYLYHWQALTISEKGYLPACDMHRWLPLGRDNGQLLSLFSYAIAYTHKVVGWISPKLTLYQIQLYAPAVCFTLGLGVLMFFSCTLTVCFLPPLPVYSSRHYPAVLTGARLVLAIEMHGAG